MIVQSGSGGLYAILARSTAYELGLQPKTTLISTTVVIQVRFRFKSLINPVLDPMLCPKTVLAGGIEQSDNTVRGTLFLNPGVTIDKIGTSYAGLCADLMLEHGPAFLMAADGMFLPVDLRDDFTTDFAKLVQAALAPFYPAKDFKEAIGVHNPFNFAQLIKGKEAPTPAPTFEALEGGKVEEETNTMLPFIPGDMEPEPPAETPAESAPRLGSKILTFGKPTENTVGFTPESKAAMVAALAAELADQEKL